MAQKQTHDHEAVRKVIDKALKDGPRTMKELEALAGAPRWVIDDELRRLREGVEGRGTALTCLPNGPRWEYELTRDPAKIARWEEWQAARIAAQSMLTARQMTIAIRNTRGNTRLGKHYRLIAAQYEVLRQTYDLMQDAREEERERQRLEERRAA